jgi:hypothetical protein
MQNARGCGTGTVYSLYILYRLATSAVVSIPMNETDQ